LGWGKPKSSGKEEKSDCYVVTYKIGLRASCHEKGHLKALLALYRRGVAPECSAIAQGKKCPILIK